MSVLVKTSFKKFVLDVLMCTHLCLFRIRNTSVFFFIKNGILLLATLLTIFSVKDSE